VRLIVSKEAGADLVRLRDFLMDRNPGAAQRAAAAIANAIRSLGMYPSVDANRLSPILANWSCRLGAQPTLFGTLFSPKPMKSSSFACGMVVSNANNPSQFLLGRLHRHGGQRSPGRRLRAPAPCAACDFDT
jgi:hypothetical protein